MSAQTASIRPFLGEPHDDLTRVELTWREKRVEHWIRFGNIADEQILDRHRIGNYVQQALLEALYLTWVQLQGLERVGKLEAIYHDAGVV